MVRSWRWLKMIKQTLTREAACCLMNDKEWSKDCKRLFVFSHRSCCWILYFSSAIYCQLKRKEGLKHKTVLPQRNLNSLSKFWFHGWEDICVLDYLWIEYKTKWFQYLFGKSRLCQNISWLLVRLLFPQLAQYHYFHSLTRSVHNWQQLTRCNW